MSCYAKRPQNPRLNGNHPLMQGLLLAAPAGEGILSVSTELRRKASQTYASMTDANFANGPCGDAWKFSGGSRITYSYSPPTLPRFTICALVVANSGTATQYAWGRSTSGTSSTAYYLGIGTSNSFTFGARLNTQNKTSHISANFSTGEPHLLVGRYDGANLQLVVDGLPGPLTAATGNASTGGSLTIGARTGDGVFPFDGLVFDARMWSRNLSDTEILSMVRDYWALYRAPKPVPVASIPAGAPPATGKPYYYALSQGLR